jgi:hypothetical protein
MLEAAASSILFPCENRISFGKEYFLKTKVLHVDKGSFCSKKVPTTELKEHLFIYEENQLWWNEEHVAHFFPVRIQLLF